MLKCSHAIKLNLMNGISGNMAQNFTRNETIHNYTYYKNLEYNI